MSIRHVSKTVAIAVAALACSGALMTGIFAGPAGASTLTSTDGNTALNTTTGPPDPGVPYDSGQPIQVVVQPNSVISASALITAGLNPTGFYYVEECTDPGGSPLNLPIGPSNCEAATLNGSATRNSTSTGGFSLTGLHVFKVYDLPDGFLGSPTMNGTCDVSPNQCVLGIFVANPNGSGGTAAFTDPHLFSAPFQTQVDAAGTDSGLGADGNPGDGTPELPLAIGLPLAAAAVLGGWMFFGRRRRQRAA